MKKLLFALGALVSVASSAQAQTCYVASPEVRVIQAQQTYCSGLYLNAFGGVNFLNNRHNDVGAASGLALGMRLNQFRVEGEFAYRYNPLKIAGVKFHRNTYAALANVYYDFDFNSAWTPYVGAGVGFAWNNYSGKFKPSENHPTGSFKHPENRDDIAYQGIAGVSHSFTSGTDLGLEYRAFMFKDKLRDQSVVASLRQSF